MNVVVPTRLQQGALLVLAAALVAAGVGGGQWFMEADYVVYGVAVSPPPNFFFVLVMILDLTHWATISLSNKQGRRERLRCSRHSRETFYMARLHRTRCGVAVLLFKFPRERNIAA